MNEIKGHLSDLEKDTFMTKVLNTLKHTFKNQ